MSKAAPAPSPRQTRNFIAWQNHVKAHGGFPLAELLATFNAAQAVGNSLAEIENSNSSFDCSPSPDTGFDP